jgi:hypothetical protein
MRRLALLVGFLLVMPLAAVGPPERTARAQAGCFQETGFCITNPAFQEYFQVRGGVRTFGYPVSREFRLLGFRVQLFQGHIMQLTSDGRVMTMNLLQEGLMPATRVNGSVFPPPDPALIAETPKVGEPNYAERIVEFTRRHAPNEFNGRPVRFFDTFMGTVDLATAFPAGGGGRALLPLLNLEIWGVPTSRPMVDPTNPGFIYQRFQRGIMHYREECRCTERILLADWFKALLTNRNLPPDLAREMAGSRFIAQYSPAAGRGLARPAALPDTDLVEAFAPGAPTVAMPRPRGEFIYGVMLTNPAETAGLARAAGFTHAWSYVRWRDIEPSKGRFVFSPVDPSGQPVANDLTNALTAARAAGLKFVLRVADPPDWAGGNVYRLNPSDVEDYVYAVVTYGRGTIAFVQVFNELNLPGNWGTTPTDPAAYVPILAAAYRGAKRADPTVRVVAAAPSPRTGGVGGTLEDVDWLDGVYRAGGRDHFDLLGMHPYLGNFPPEAEPTCAPMCFRTVELWRAVMEKYGDGAKQALITEVGTLEQTPIDLGSFEWMELPTDKRAEHLVQALRLAGTSYPWIAGALVFNLDAAATPWHPPTSEVHWFSLLNPDKSPRPAYTLFRQARLNGTLP